MAKLRVTRPTPPGGYYGGQAFCRYTYGDCDGGYDAALVLRYQGAAAFYRVQLSTAYGEVALWKPSGGFLQVKSVALKANELYEFKAEAAGPHVRAWINGQAVLDYWDRVAPILAGRAGSESTTRKCVSRVCAGKMPRRRALCRPGQPAGSWCGRRAE